MHALKITQIGNSLGLILPKEVLARLKVTKGDQIFMTDAPDGMRVSPYSGDTKNQLKADR
jgi:putative addiction module antidote